MSKKEESNKLSDIFQKVVDSGIDDIFSSKDQIVSIIKKELVGRLSKLDISKEVDRILTEYEFELKVNAKKKK